MFVVLYLDPQNCVLAKDEILNLSLMQIRDYQCNVVERAFYHNAASEVFAHNHPSFIWQNKAK